jgi:hypothetical protein
MTISGAIKMRLPTCVLAPTAWLQRPKISELKFKLTIFLLFVENVRRLHISMNGTILPHKIVKRLKHMREDEVRTRLKIGTTLDQ